MWQKLEYIHNNRVRAGIVKAAEHYQCSSGADYFYGRQVGRVKIERQDAMVVVVK